MSDGTLGAMENPWLSLIASDQGEAVADKDGKFVLKIDSAAINSWCGTPDRKRKSDASKFKNFFLEILPQPYVGNRDAPVVILGLNPGFCAKDLEDHKCKAFQKAQLENFQSQAEVPFYFLDENLKDTAGSQWWKKRLRVVIEKAGLTNVQNNLLCVEWFPYHSKKFAPLHNVLPSQEYGFQLVRGAMRRNALIIGLRSKQIWYKSIPKLECYEKHCFLKSPQCAYVTENNCPCFCDVIKALSAGGTTTG